MSNIFVSVKGKDCREEWDNYVSNHPRATPYHYSAWLVSVEEAYGMYPYYVMAHKDGCVVGVLPLVLIKRPLDRGILVSLPYCDSGSPLADNGQVEDGMLQEVIRLSCEIKAKKIDLRGKELNDQFSSSGFVLQQVKNDKVSMILELPDGSEELWNGFKSKLRSQVRKAEKNGISFAWSKETDVNSFYDVFSENMRDLGSPVHSKSWFKAILLTYGENARLGVVYKETDPVGAAIILKIGSRVSVPWASTLLNYNRMGPNMLLYLCLLKFAADNNCEWFDFGRSTPGEGTYKFKAQWGARPEKLYWYSLSQCLEKGEDSGLFGFPCRHVVERMWSFLPLRVANYLGAALRKYISL